MPLCEENINWYIFKDIYKISNGSLTRIKNLFSGNPEFAKGNGNNREI
ncbi:MAG: hypothetical protein JKX98_12515 [Alcanivoracaceae bacterium]|nr:hypothetical protein [Alcanivoracaceae bacterium]